MAVSMEDYARDVFGYDYRLFDESNNSLCRASDGSYRYLILGGDGPGFVITGQYRYQNQQLISRFGFGNRNEQGEINEFFACD